MRLLSVENLRAGYGEVRVLHGLTLDVAEGGITALLGANGAGKTTTLRALSRMIPSTGRIVLQGRPIDGLSTETVARLGLVHVPEGRGTFTRLSVAENLLLGAITRRDRAAVAADLERVYDTFPVLARRRTQQAGTLSGGEQQMLAIGRALMLRPRLLLLDEPSFGLAPLIVQEVFRILTDINRCDGVGMLLVEQNAALALSIADQAYLIETGEIVMYGPAAQVGNEAAVRRAYLGY